MPSGPATAQRVASGSTRTKLPAETGTSAPSIRQWPPPRITTDTSSWPDVVSSCS